jgi:hypothetical protein
MWPPMVTANSKDREEAEGRRLISAVCAVSGLPSEAVSVKINGEIATVRLEYESSWGKSPSEALSRPLTPSSELPKSRPSSRGAEMPEIAATDPELDKKKDENGEVESHIRTVRKSLYFPCSFPWNPPQHPQAIHFQKPILAHVTCVNCERPEPHTLVAQAFAWPPRMIAHLLAAEASQPSSVLRSETCVLGVSDSDLSWRRVRLCISLSLTANDEANMLASLVLPALRAYCRSIRVQLTWSLLRDCPTDRPVTPTELVERLDMVSVRLQRFMFWG